MAKQQTTDLKVRLLIEGFEGLDKIKSSFRDLGKVTNLAEKDILKARASLLEIAKESGNTEAVTAGLISAFKGLRTQTDQCGDAYKQLSDDLRKLNEVSRGATDSLMAQRQAVLSTAAATTQNVAALTQQRDALVALRAQTRESSQAFEQFSEDIQRVEARLGNLAEVNRNFNRAITQGTAATAAGAQVSLTAITQGISLRRAEIASIDLLTQAQRKETENVRERIRLQRSLNIALTQQGILQFQESARAGRERVRAAGRTFNSGTLTAGALSPEGMANRFGLGGQIPNTTAGLNQELGELSERLINTYRHTENYIEVQLRLAAVQREATAATQGFAARLVADLDTGTTISSQKNLREAIAALRSEMVELDLTTSAGTAAYAQHATEVRRLELRLNTLANAYRHVSDAAKSAPAQGINPFTASGATNPAYAAQQREELERVTRAAEARSLDAIDALLSAKRTMYEYEAGVLRTLDAEKDDLNNKDLARQRKIAKAEEEAFQKELQRLDIRKQQIAATKEAMGFNASRELSPLYGRIANLGASEVDRQQQLMGRNPTQVFNDIVESFNAGGRPVDLKQRSTAIGGSVAEGVAQGANDSAATTTGARTFADKLIRAYKAAFRIKSPSGESEEKIGIPIGQGIGQGILKGINGFKAQIKAAILDLTAQVGKAPLPLSMGPGSPLADRAQSQLARSTTRTSTYLPLTRLMGEGVLGSEAMSVAAERRMFENRSRVIPLGGAVPGGPSSYPSALSPQDRRGLRGTAGIPGAGLESMIVSAVTKAVSRTGALAGPLNRPQTITVNIPSLQRPGISPAATRATQSPLPVFSAPTQPTPLQATLPGMGYRMGGAPAPNFPIDGPLRGLTGPTGQKAAAASLTEAISKYRKAADNFWFSETSTFQTIRNIIGSGAQVAASKGALALSNVRLNTAGLTAAATKLTNLPSTTISNISSLLSGQGAKLTTTLQASGTQLRTQFTKLQTSADTLKTSTAQIFTGIGTGLTQRASTFRSGLTANLPFFGGGSGGSGGPPIPPFPPAPPPPPPLPPTGGSSESFAKLNNGLKEFGPLSQRSLKSIQALGGALEELRSELSPLDADYRQVNRSIQQQQQLIQRETARRQPRQRAPLTGMQTAQGVGAAISGGIFGGPEGLLGGLGGLAVGGVGGAFAGAAAGAQVGMFRQQIAGTADYAASIGKLQIALRGVAGSEAEYNKALAAAGKATRELNVPQEDAIRGITRLSAAIIGAGGTVEDSSFAFRSISEAIKATGGSAEQVDGAMLALTQVFSKGKVSAEELNQIAERLPGTFTLFAKATGKTGPELQKGLQQGQVGLNDLMKFLELASTTYGKTALKIADSSQDAGGRLKVAFDDMRLAVGNAVQPLGAELQDSFAKFITEITPDVIDSVKGIADAFKFFKDSSVAQGLVEFALKIGGITLALKALRAVAGTTAATNLANWFTGTAAAGKITGDVLQTTSVKAAGLGGNLLKARTALGLLTTAAAKPVVLTIVILSVIEAINRIREARDAFEDFKKSTKQPGASNWLKDIGGSALSADQLKAQKAPLDAAIKSNKFEIAKLQKEKRNLELQALNVATGSEAAPINTEIVTVTAKIQTAQQNIKNAESRLAAVNKALASASNKPAKRSDFDTPGGNEEAEKNREKLRDAFNKREDAMLEARQQREEKLADIRVQAAEQAKQIEQDLADTRRALERELQDMARNRAYAAEDSERRIRALSGGDASQIQVEQDIADIYRRSRETAITNERRFSDEQQGQDRKIAEFQENIAKGIREANDAHTKKMGDIQKQYAKEVAKIVEKGGATSGKSMQQGGSAAAQQLILAGKITSLNNQRTQMELNRAQFTNASGIPLVPIPRPVREKEQLVYPGVSPTDVTPEFRELDKQLDLLERKLQDIVKRAAAPEPAKPASTAAPKPVKTSSLPGEVPFSFDVSKIGRSFGEIASAAFGRGLLAQLPLRGGATSTRVRDPDAETTGYDIVMPGGQGAAVQAPVPLTITGTGFQGSGSGPSGKGYGNYVTGTFKLGGKTYEIVLAHFDQVNVAPGMQVPAGAKLGTQGTTGRATGPHVSTHVNPTEGNSAKEAWKALDAILNAYISGRPVPNVTSTATPVAVQGYVPASVAPAAAATTQLRDTAEGQAETDRVATAIREIDLRYKTINESSAQLTSSLNDQLGLLDSTRKFLDEGFSEGLSRSLAAVNETAFSALEDINAAFREEIVQIEQEVNDKKRTPEAGETAKAEADVRRLQAITDATANLELNKKLTIELEKQNNLYKTRQDDRIGLGMKEGVQSYLESIGTMREATQQLTVKGIKGLEDSIYDLVTTGTTNFREFAANMLRDTARMIIQQLVLRNVLRMVQNIFGFESGGVFGPSMQPVPGYAKGAAFSKPMGGTISTYAKGGMFDEYAAGGAFAANKIMPFAKGSAFSNTVVSSPTLFKFASGGAMQTGVMGEAGPEAVMPLKRGPDGRLGVTSNISGANTNSSAVNNVTVNVDASGSKVQGDSNKSEQLGRAVSQAVQEELVRQKLPGGLLS